jgi:hypothetical protein
VPILGVPPNERSSGDSNVNVELKRVGVIVAEGFALGVCMRSFPTERSLKISCSRDKVLLDKRLEFPKNAGEESAPGLKIAGDIVGIPGELKDGHAGAAVEVVLFCFVLTSSFSFSEALPMISGVFGGGFSSSGLSML